MFMSKYHGSFFTQETDLQVFHGFFLKFFSNFTDKDYTRLLRLKYVEVEFRVIWASYSEGRFPKASSLVRPHHRCS